MRINGPLTLKDILFVYSLQVLQCLGLARNWIA